MLKESLVNLNHRDNLTSSKFTIEHIPSKLLPDKKKVGVIGKTLSY